VNKGEVDGRKTVEIFNVNMSIYIYIYINILYYTYIETFLGKK
jgi:hypothetical protein